MRYAVLPLATSKRGWASRSDSHPIACSTASLAESCDLDKSSNSECPAMSPPIDSSNVLRFSRGRSGSHRCRIVPRSGRRARRLQPLVRSGLATDCTPFHSQLLPSCPQPAPTPRLRRRARAQMGGYPPRAWRRRGPTETSAHPPTPDLLESAAPSPTCHSVQAPRQPRRRGPKCPQVDSHADRTQLTTMPPRIHECGSAR